MKPGFLSVLCLAGSLIAGCSLTKSDRSSSRGGLSFFGQRQVPDQGDEPQADDERFQDDYETLGKQARGNRPREKQNDPLSKWIDSPTSRQISRDLGYE